MAEVQEVVRIVTNAPRRRVKVDEDEFELLDIREMNLVEKSKALQVNAAIIKLTEGKLSDPEIAALQKDLRRLVEAVMPAVTATALGKLTDEDCCEIVFAFCAPRRKLAPEGTETQSQRGS